jgi:hypothetical protein
MLEYSQRLPIGAGRAGDRQILVRAGAAGGGGARRGAGGGARGGAIRVGAWADLLVPWPRLVEGRAGRRGAGRAGLRRPRCALSTASGRPGGIWCAQGRHHARDAVEARFAATMAALRARCELGWEALREVFAPHPRPRMAPGRADPGRGAAGRRLRRGPRHGEPGAAIAGRGRADRTQEARRDAGGGASGRRARLEIPVIRLEVLRPRARLWLSRAGGRRRPRPGRGHRPAGPARRAAPALSKRCIWPMAAPCGEDRWLNPAALPPGARFRHAVSANEWLVANVPRPGRRWPFWPPNGHPQEAAALEVAPGTALSGDRADDAGPAGAITDVRLWHRPGHRVETRL